MEDLKEVEEGDWKFVTEADLSPSDAIAPDRRRELQNSELKGFIGCMLVAWFGTGLALSLVVGFIWACRYAWLHAG